VSSHKGQDIGVTRHGQDVGQGSGRQSQGVKGHGQEIQEHKGEIGERSVGERMGPHGGLMRDFGLLSSLFDFDRFLLRPPPPGVCTICEPGATSVGNLRMDVIEGEHDYRLVMDTPGVKKEDIHIDLQEDGFLTVMAERSHNYEQQGGQYHRVERSFGKLTRSMKLPATVDKENISANYENGCLQVVLPKRDPQQIEKSRRRIGVQ